jgi:putative membrane protein
MPLPSPRLPLALGLIVLLALAVSAIAPADRVVWWMEVLPAMLAVVLLGATWRRFPLTSLLYWLIAAHALVLILGGAYTYAHVPLGFWLQDVFELARNPYDRIGHFMQGFVPAMIAREILLRRGFVRAGRMAAFLCICVALAISAFYEMIEWWAALIMEQGAAEFLGTQGDVWDTQWDMFLALVGATLAVSLLGRWHDRQLAAMPA